MCCSRVDWLVMLYVCYTCTIVNAILFAIDPTFMPSADEHSLAFALCTGAEVSELILNHEKMRNEYVVIFIFAWCVQWER